MSEAVDVEAEAKRDGWAPKDQWRGDPDKWVDAETFVDRGKQIAAIKIERLENQVAQQARTLEEVKSFRDKELQRIQKESAKQIAALEAERAKAIDDGDGARFAEADREISQIREQQQPEQNPVKEISAQWERDNPWYQTDEEMAIYADGVSSRVAAMGLEGSAYFNEITNRVKDRFPERFENPRRGNPAPVADPGGSNESSTGRTYDDLPRDHKAECDRVCSELGIKPEAWLAQYEWED